MYTLTLLTVVTTAALAPAQTGGEPIGRGAANGGGVRSALTAPSATSFQKRTTSRGRGGSAGASTSLAVRVIVRGTR